MSMDIRVESQILVQETWPLLGFNPHSSAWKAGTISTELKTNWQKSQSLLQLAYNYLPFKCNGKLIACLIQSRFVSWDKSEVTDTDQIQPNCSQSKPFKSLLTLNIQNTRQSQGYKKLLHRNIGLIQRNYSW